jgi:hypothetical protein
MRARLRAVFDGVLTGVTVGLVDESDKGCRLFQAFLDGRGRRGCRLARGQSPLEPHPIHEHGEPEEAEEE